MNFLMLHTLKPTLIVLLFIGCMNLSYSQTQDDQSNFWKQVRFGGNVGLSFGSGFFSGTLAPSAVYEFNPKFALGLGLNGTYNRSRNRFSSTIFGGSLISFFNPIPELQTSAEFEQLNVNQKFENSSLSNRNYWVPALLMGVGYRTNNVVIGMRYDLLFNRDKSIYADPWMPFIRVFF